MVMQKGYYKRRDLGRRAVDFYSAEEIAATVGKTGMWARETLRTYALEHPEECTIIKRGRGVSIYVSKRAAENIKEIFAAPSVNTKYSHCVSYANDYLSRTEVANLLGIGQATARRRIKRLAKAHPEAVLVSQRGSSVIRFLKKEFLNLISDGKKIARYDSLAPSGYDPESLVSINEVCDDCNTIKRYAQHFPNNLIFLKSNKRGNRIFVPNKNIKHLNDYGRANRSERYMMYASIDPNSVLTANKISRNYGKDIRFVNNLLANAKELWPDNVFENRCSYGTMLSIDSRFARDMLSIDNISNADSARKWLEGCTKPRPTYIDGDDELFSIYKTYGFTDAKKAIMEKYVALVYRVCRDMIRPGGPWRIDDVAPHGFLGLERAVNNYQYGKGAKFISFAYVCIRSAILRGMHNEKRPPGEFTRPFGSAYEDSDKQIDVECEDMTSYELERSDLSAAVRRAVSKLPERQRNIITARLDGKSLQAIGDDMNLTEQRIEQIEKGAHEKLRVIMMQQHLG